MQCAPGDADPLITAVEVSVEDEMVAQAVSLCAKVEKGLVHGDGPDADDLNVIVVP